MAEEKKVTAKTFSEITTTEKPPEYGEFWKPQALGDSVEGFYRKRRTNKASGKEQSLYDLEGEAGDKWTLNGNFDLDAKMKKARLGDYIRVTYADDVDMGENLSPRRIFKVEKAN